MKFYAVIFVIVAILRNCDCANVNTSSNFEDLAISNNSDNYYFKVFSKIDENYLFKSFLRHNLTQKCSDDVKILQKALSNFELWALKSMRWI